MSHKQLNQDLKDVEPGTLDLVCFSHLRWDFVYQRPQHLMSRSARERRVFFIEEPIFTDTPAHLEMEKGPFGLTVVKPHLPMGLAGEEVNDAMRKLVDHLFEQEIDEFILWYYTPMALEYSRHLKPALTVYDCMDQLSMFKDAPDRLKELEPELIHRADLVFTGGKMLYEAKLNGHDNVYLFPSSIDAPHFEQARHKQTEPADQMNIPSPRLGYFGVIDERMDLALLDELAQVKPDWHLVIMGPVVKINPNTLPVHPNIHYLGMKAYHELPRYLSGWDVALLPFALNDSTRFISPTKIPEYLAGGKPVVSTPIHDVIDPYGRKNLVSIAGSSGEFVEAIERILLMDQDDRASWLDQVDQQISQNSWDYTWKKMMTLIESSMAAREEEAKPDETIGKHPDATLPRIAVDLELKKSNGRGNGSGKIRSFDYLIVGAGFAGSVLAERLTAGSGNKVLIIDQRSHIAGNAYDYYNPEGILIHKYGPHIFHTNSHEVFNYLSQFTDWRQYQHRVLASVDGQLLPLPINLDTINRLYGLNLNAFELEDFFKKVAEPREKIATSEDVVVSKIGRELYEKFFRNYTRKQWDYDPSELDASVTSRVPIRYNRDDRYFSDIYQVMPLHGYTRMFENMLDHPNIKIMLNTSYQEIKEMVSYREVIFTGPVDEYFEFIFGKLPYRSLQFKFETLNEERHQPVAVINYPNEYPYTRVTEFKHLTGQAHPKTTLVYEYPTMNGDPYYPIPRPENAQLYARYQKLAAQKRGVHFAGRLGTYKYYNMDQVVAQAITLYSKIQGLERNKATKEHTLHYLPVSVPVTGRPEKSPTA